MSSEPPARSCRFAVVVLVVVACGNTQPAATKSPTAATERSAYEQLEARIPPILDAMNRLAESIKASGGECGQIAAAIRAFGAKYAGEMAELWKLRGRLTERDKERWEHEHDEDVQRLDAVFKTSMEACAGNPEVEAAMDVSGFRDKPSR